MKETRLTIGNRRQFFLDLKDCLMFCAPKADVRYYMHGVAIAKVGDDYSMVGCDAIHLLCVGETVSNKEYCVFKPEDTRRLAKMAGSRRKGFLTLDLGVGGKHEWTATAYPEKAQERGDLVEATYPDIRNVLPDSEAESIEFDVAGRDWQALVPDATTRKQRLLAPISLRLSRSGGIVEAAGEPFSGSAMQTSIEESYQDGWISLSRLQTAMKAGAKTMRGRIDETYESWNKGETELNVFSWRRGNRVGVCMGMNPWKAK